MRWWCIWCLVWQQSLPGRYFRGKLEPEVCVNYLREGKISPRKTYCIAVFKMKYGAGFSSAVKGTYCFSKELSSVASTYIRWFTNAYNSSSR